MNKTLNKESIEEQIKQKEAELAEYNSANFDSPLMVTSLQQELEALYKLKEKK